MDGWVGGCLDGQMVGRWIRGRTDRQWTDAEMGDGSKDEHIDGWVDGRTDSQMVAGWVGDG